MVKLTLEYAVVEHGKSEPLGLFVYADEAHVLASGLEREDNKHYDVVNIEPIPINVEIHQ